MNKKVIINIGLEIGFCNGRMGVSIFQSGKKLWQNQSNFDLQNFINLSVEWPLELEVVVDGKDMSQDTLLDSEGNILQNKYIKLISMSINGIELKEFVLRDISYWKPDQIDIPYQETFWDQNGRVNWSFDTENPMKWHLKKNNRFFNNEL